MHATPAGWPGVFGLLAVVAGVHCSVLANTALKLLDDVPTLQLMQLRFLCQFALTMAIVGCMRLCGRPLRLLGAEGTRVTLVARAVCFSSGLGCLWMAIRKIPLGEATAIAYINPIICGLLAKAFLREELGLAFWVHGAASCVGVLAVVLPHGDSAEWGTPGRTEQVQGVLFALGAAGFFAANQVLTRLLSGLHPLEVQVWQDAVTALLICPCARALAAPGGAATILGDGAWDFAHVRGLAIFTVAGFSACFLLITGFTMAPASQATVFTYMEVPSSFLIQVLYFHEVPTIVQILGAGLIVTAACVRIYLQAMAIPPQEEGGAAAPAHREQDVEVASETSPLLK